MDYEQRYKDALKKAKKFYNDEQVRVGMTPIELEEIFPELKISEDEKIRKELIFYLGGMPEDTELRNGVTNRDVLVWLEKQEVQKEDVYSKEFWGEIRKNLSDFLQEFCECGINTNFDKWTKSDCVNWLLWVEKQGEQKPFDYENANIQQKDFAPKIEPKFKVGDYVVDNCGYLWRIEGIMNQFYLLESIDGGESRPTIEWVNKTFHLWTIQDAKDGDVLANDHHILILRELGYSWAANGNPDSLYAYCGIKPNGNFELEQKGYCFCGTLHTHPATKEQRDLLFKKMKESGYEWDAEKKELKKIEDEPNKCEGCNNAKGCVACVDGSEWAHVEESEPAWSKEDEQHIDSLLKRLDGLCRNEFERTRFAINEDEDWLKSLKPQNRWKPSDEQVNAFEHFVRSWGESGISSPYDNHTKLIYSLLQDLKKLKG